MTTEQFQRETGRFRVESEDGTPYTLIETTTFYRYFPINQEPQTRKGPSSYELDDGSPVNQRKNGTFQIVDSGEILRKL